MLCDLLLDPLESQKRAAGNALKNLADPAVLASMHRVITVLLRKRLDPILNVYTRKIDNVFLVMREARETSTFEAVAELSTNILMWEPPAGDDGIEAEMRLALVSHIVKPHVEDSITEARAPVVVRLLLLLVKQRVNVEWTV